MSKATKDVLIVSGTVLWIIVRFCLITATAITVGSVRGAFRAKVTNK